MSLQQRLDLDQEDKGSLLHGHEDHEQRRHDSRSPTPRLLNQAKVESVGNGFLAAPDSRPVRPLSPDTLSNLSADEYEQLRPSRPSSRNAGRLWREAQAPPLRPHGWRRELEAFWVKNKGLAYMVLAQVFGTLMNVTTRLLEIEGNHGKGLHPFQILFARMGITVVLASGYMWYCRTPYFPLGLPAVRWLLVARGFGGFFGVFGMYYSLRYLPLADATVVTFLAPPLTCWVCSLLINEPFGGLEKVAAFVALLGVVLIARPTSLFAPFWSNQDTPPGAGDSDVIPDTNSTAPAVGTPDAASYGSVTPMQRLLAVGVALLGVLGSTMAYTTIRWIGKRAHPLISVNYFAVWCTIVSTMVLLVSPSVGFQLPVDLKEWAYLIFLGTCGFVMQFLLAAGLAYERSSRATNITYTQVLFALAFDKMIFGHTPDLMSIAGSTLILGSAIVVATMANASNNTGGKEQTDCNHNAIGDEESQQGLLSGMRVGVTDVESGEDHDRLAVQEVQLRTLR